MLTRSLEISNNLGYDLILDFNGKFSTQKRDLMKLLSFMAKIVTMSNNI
jgi:hypothetical protein